MHAFRKPASAAAVRFSRAAALETNSSLLTKIFRRPEDVWLVQASFIFVAAVLLVPSRWTFALGIWWLLNTVAHNFIHHPFFRSRSLNRCFAFYLTLVTSIPQRLWRDRHLAHHADRSWRLRFSRELVEQSVLLAACWCGALVLNPVFVRTELAPGIAGALVLCWLHGHYEHARATTSHNGPLYNVLFFNDGFHVEHHRSPKLHWSDLRSAPDASRSPFPAVLRWLDWFSLSHLERITTRCSWIRHWLVAVHGQALRKVWGRLAPPKRVAIIGGGLFPRSALVARRLWPSADLVIYEMSAAHLQEAQLWLTGDETIIQRRVTSPQQCAADLVIVPLALDLDKASFYTPANGQRILVHDWLWRKRAQPSAIVSFWILKRMNLVEK